MALLLPHSIFFHIPKTGGNWVRTAILNAGIAVNEIGPRTCPVYQSHLPMQHCSPSEVCVENMFTFGFVRNPLTYYQSLWSYFMREAGKPGLNTPLYRTHMSSCFGDFVRSIQTHEPGWLTNAYKAYTGDRGERLSYIGRQEHLTDDLITALTMAGEEFQETLIRQTSRTNVASMHSQYRDQCHYTRELAELVIEREIEIFLTYGYSTDVHTAMSSTKDRAQVSV